VEGDNAKLRFEIGHAVADDRQRRRPSAPAAPAKLPVSTMVNPQLVERGGAGIRRRSQAPSNESSSCTLSH
jgi:hypothetical protein